MPTLCGFGAIHFGQIAAEAESIGAVTELSVRSKF